MLLETYSDLCSCFVTSAYDIKQRRPVSFQWNRYINQSSKHFSDKFVCITVNCFGLWIDIWLAFSSSSRLKPTAVTLLAGILRSLIMTCDKPLWGHLSHGEVNGNMLLKLDKTQRSFSTRLTVQQRVIPFYDYIIVIMCLSTGCSAG